MSCWGKHTYVLKFITLFVKKTFKILSSGLAHKKISMTLTLPLKKMQQHLLVCPQSCYWLIWHISSAFFLYPYFCLCLFCSLEFVLVSCDVSGDYRPFVHVQKKSINKVCEFLHGRETLKWQRDGVGTIHERHTLWTWKGDLSGGEEEGRAQRWLHCIKKQLIKKKEKVTKGSRYLCRVYA